MQPAFLQYKEITGFSIIQYDEYKLWKSQKIMLPLTMSNCPPKVT